MPMPSLSVLFGFFKGSSYIYLEELFIYLEIVTTGENTRHATGLSRVLIGPLAQENHPVPSYKIVSGRDGYMLWRSVPR